MFSRRAFRLLLAAGLLAGAAGAQAQNKLSPANLFGPNAGFESSTTENNPWDGVTKEGYLSGAPFSASVLSENGLRQMAMPPSVAFADLNGDGKPDLLTVDPRGVFRFYENVGTAPEPAFRSAEIVPLFISTSPIKHNPTQRGGDRFAQARFVPRFALADWRRSGVLDLLVGNYLGELLFIPNTGSARQPVFRQPRPLESALLKTNARGQLTANLLAPAAMTLPGVGGNRTDLVLGEGTYSANAVRLLENLSPGSRPQFSEEKTWPLAYGDGKELLIPAVVDYDGDGRPDLLVADRTGQVSVYLAAAGWKPGQELPFASRVSFGGSDKLPGLCALCAADFNGDGLFDLLIGQPNGRIAVALNTGARGQPKFGPPQELKGEKRLTNWEKPAAWGLESSQDDGNLLSYLTVVGAGSDPESQPPEGTHCLKAGYWPAGNRVFAAPFENIPPEVRWFEISNSGNLEAGKTYTLSFKLKGRGVEKIHYVLAGGQADAEGDVRIEKLERGVKKISRFGSEAGFALTGEAAAGANWATVSRTFTFQTRPREVPKGTRVQLGFRLSFTLDRADAAAYFDDFQLVEGSR